MNGRRENRIDFLRGLSLLFIFIGHAEFTFSLAFQHARGFSDASEIFVLLSGVSAALAYYRGGAGLQLERPWKRAFRLYIVHILLFALMATEAAIALDVFNDTAWAIEMIDFWRNPFRHSWEALSLAYMPGNLDILPLYVLLLLATPFLFVLHDRSKSLLLGLSLLVWIVAGLAHINLVNVALPGNAWYFDPLSWQLIFVIGIFMGIRMRQGVPVMPYNKVLFVGAAAFAIAAIPLNLAIYLDVIPSPFGHLHHELVSKTNGGPLRVANVLAILYLVWNIPAIKTLADHPSMRLLCVAGRHSLPVFSLGILLSFCAMVMMNVRPATPLAVQMLALVLGCAFQLALGAILEKRKIARATAGGLRPAPMQAGKLSPAE